MSININWKTVHEIRNCGHGVEVFFANSLKQTDKLNMAFIVGFAWTHGSSDDVAVSVLSLESIEFTKRQLNGVEIISLLKMSLLEYLARREVPLHRIEMNLSPW